MAFVGGDRGARDGRMLGFAGRRQGKGESPTVAGTGPKDGGFAQPWRAGPWPGGRPAKYGGVVEKDIGFSVKGISGMKGTGR